MMTEHKSEKFNAKDLTNQDWIKANVSYYIGKYRMLFMLVVLASIWATISGVVYFVEVGKEGSNITSYTDSLWWGLVTFLTVGYGDRFPVTPEGRVISAMLMFAGVIAIGILTAKISSIFLKQALLEGRGAVNKNKLYNHFIVCGWKEDLSALLKHILDFNPDLTQEQLVLVANLSPEQINALKANKQLENISVIVGDFFQQAILQRAAPEKARKVLVLADKTRGPSGQIPNAMESDARTIMTAIALSNIAKNTLVAAEILDPTLDQYLTIAGVGEVIYSSEYSRLLLGSASVGSGIANVFHDLLDPKAETHVVTEDIPEEYEDGEFAKYRSYFEGRHSDSMVIGILENTGNPNKIKELALREAQKTPSIDTLISNLKGVKQIRCNSPVFHPGLDYKIPKGAAAIILKRRRENNRAA